MCVHKQIRETEKAIQMVSQIPQQRDSRLSISTPRSWPPTQEPLRTTILNQTPKLMLLLGNTNTHTNQCLLHLLHYQHYLWVYSIYIYIYIYHYKQIQYILPKHIRTHKSSWQGFTHQIPTELSPAWVHCPPSPAVAMPSDVETLRSQASRYHARVCAFGHYLAGLSAEDDPVLEGPKHLDLTRS